MTIKETKIDSSFSSNLPLSPLFYKVNCTRWAIVTLDNQSALNALAKWNEKEEGEKNSKEKKQKQNKTKQADVLGYII